MFRKTVWGSILTLSIFAVGAMVYSNLAMKRAFDDLGEDYYKDIWA